MHSVSRSKPGKRAFAGGLPGESKVHDPRIVQEKPESEKRLAHVSSSKAGNLGIRPWSLCFVNQFPPCSAFFPRFMLVFQVTFGSIRPTIDLLLTAWPLALCCHHDDHHRRPCSQGRRQQKKIIRGGHAGPHSHCDYRCLSHDHRHRHLAGTGRSLAGSLSSKDSSVLSTDRGSSRPEACRDLSRGQERFSFGQDSSEHQHWDQRWK